MNLYGYHHTILQQPHYAYGVPISPVPAPWVQVIPVHYATGEPYPRFVHYLDEVAILDTPNTMRVNQGPEDTFFNRSSTYIHRLEALIEESLIMQELDVNHHSMQQPIGNTTSSGLSKEEISKHLNVYTGNKSESCEVDTCSICLCDCEINEKIGRLDCGHRYHVECIKSWLSSKNVCPMCRSVALRV